MIRFKHMFDTINPTEASLFEYLFRHGTGKSSEIQAFIAENANKQASLITVKRLLGKLTKEGALKVSGKGPATTYALTPLGKLSANISASDYCLDEPDTRFGSTSYQFDLFPAVTADPFTPQELEALEAATNFYHEKSKELSATLHQKELERFVIELSWKSSRIEGNTYTLLDTEKLLLHGTEAEGHSKDEATMILDHKAAFSYIYENRKDYLHLSRAGIERIHELLTRNLPIARNLRSSPVGVTGSRYRPLDNRYQIEEAISALTAAVERMPNGYAKALVALIGLSYIQPFEDGNKRTARLTANAVLLAHGLSPLSYRSVSEEEYREATLVFYELNSYQPFKRLFVKQYEFAARNYLI